jgi:hypothetical protein
MPPDLTTPEARRANRRELLGVARFWRIAGFAAMVAALGGLILTVMTEQPLWTSCLGIGSLLPIAVGWAMFIYVIVKRTRYHRRRMRGDAP